MSARTLAARIQANLEDLSGRQTRLVATLALPSGAIILGEGLLFLGLVRASLGVHLTTLVLCSLAPLTVEREAMLFRAFALLPLFRLLNLGLPVFAESTLVWLPLVYGLLLVAAVTVATIQPGFRVPSRDTLRRAVIYAPLGVVLAVVLASIEYALLGPEPLIRSLSGTGLLALGIVMLLFVGLGEELVFRGVLQGSLRTHIGPWQSVLLSALLFGMMHAPTGLPAELAFAIGVGVLLGAIYERTGSLALVTLIHGVLNVFLFGPFPVVGPIIGG